MDTHATDCIVIGGGIAGASAAAHLAADRRVALVEAEEAAGYHTTGRSAALWILNYGPADVRALTGASRGFFEAPPEGFADVPLWSARDVLYLAAAGDAAAADEVLADGVGLRRIAVAEARAMVPAIREGAVSAALVESGTFDLDVAALHQGFLAQLRRRGGAMALRSRTMRIERRAGAWEVAVTGGAVFRAPVLVNAAGAWGDEVAGQAGVRPVGLVPKRRTGVIVDAAPWHPADWPALMDMRESWYGKPEARTRLMISPADATPVHAHDVQPDELDVAIAVDRMQQVLDIEVTRVERAWAGLRTFSPDGSLCFGFAPDAEGFFWCVGQGGYGIQTSPAAGRLVADLVAGRAADWLGDSVRLVAAISAGAIRVTESFDSLVVGGGIAGATAAFHLSAEGRVALIEAEEAAGYHTTGRSAALWVANGGPDYERALARELFGFLAAPPPGFAQSPILRERPVAFAVPEEQVADLRAMLAVRDNVREIAVDALRAMVPAVRPGYAAAAALETGNYDIDVDVLLQGYLRQARARGAVVAFRRRSQRIERVGGLWRVETAGGAVFRARVLVNAAGAWGDEVAGQAGVRPLGLVAKRRTAVLVDPAPYDVRGWPRLYDARRSWYLQAGFGGAADGVAGRCHA